MKTFKDSAGTEWHVSVTVGSAKKVKQSLDFDLLDTLDGTAVEAMAADPALLVNVLYVICRSQADQRGITDEQFGQPAGRPTCSSAPNAAKAMLEELLDFFPGRQRKVLRRALQLIMKEKTHV